MFEALLERRREEQRTDFIVAGVVAAAIYNANPFRGKDAKAVGPLDFVPEYLKGKGSGEKRQSIRQQVAVLAGMLRPGAKGPYRVN